HHKGPSSLSPQATRNEFRKPSNRWEETRKGTRLTSRTNRPSKLYLRSSVLSTTWFSPLAIASICRTLPTQILNRPGVRSSCATGLRWLLLNSRVRVFERVALSCSPPELPGSAHIKDGWLLRVSAERSRP